MAEGRIHKAREPREADSPRFSRKRFECSPEFANFTVGMKKLLLVPKVEVDEMVRTAKEASPRVDNPKAAGRKRKTPDQ